jgi:hypothetical protein
MDESSQIIRLEIEGRWSVEEMGNVFLALSELYDLRLVLESLNDEWRLLDRYYGDFVQRFPPFSRRRRRFLSFPAPWELGPFSTHLPTLDETYLARISHAFDPDERLQVRRVSYASPGSIDLVGIGAVVGHIKDFALKMIERHDLKRHRELSDEREALENERLRLENARSFVALARDLGYTDAEVRGMVAYVDERQEHIASAIETGRLRAISDLSDPQAE